MTERRGSKFHNEDYQYPKFIPETPKKTPKLSNNSKKQSQNNLRRQNNTEDPDYATPPQTPKDPGVDVKTPQSPKSIMSTPKSSSNKTPSTPRAVQVINMKRC